MTQVGVSGYTAGPVLVTSVGVNVWDGWVKVAGIDGSALPAGTGDYGFFVSANLCEVSSPQTSSVALIEIGIGTNGRPFFDTIQAVKFDGSVFFGRTSTPYTQCWNAAAASRGAWNAANNFEVYARISQNGGTTASGGFRVSDIVMHAFAFSRLANSQYGAQDAGATAYGGAPNTLTTFGNWILTAGDRDYVLFYSCNYYPNPNSRVRAAIGLEFQRDRTGPIIDETYWMQRGGIGVAYRDRGVNQVGNTRFGDGGFRSLRMNASDPNPGFRMIGWSKPNATSFDGGIYLSSDWFLIDSAELGNFKEIEIAVDDNLHNDGGVQLQNVTSEGFEFVRTFFADVEFLFAMEPLAWFTQAGDAQQLTNPYRQCVQLNSGGQPSFDYAAQCRTNEPFVTVSGAHFDRLQSAEVRFDLFGWGVNTGTNKRRLAGRIRAIQWDWNDDPQVTPSTAPNAGPVTYLQPGYEGFETGTLAEIPIPPSEVADVQDVDPKHRIETDFGYELTWPALTTYRQRMTLRWSGITTLERDTLALWFSLQLTRAFKYTNPIDGVVALVAVGKFSANETQTLHTCSVSCVELKYQGP